MKKNFLHSAKSYAKNLGKHIGRVVKRRETIGEAVEDLQRDSKKLMHAATPSPDAPETRKAAVRLVKAGRKAYNAKKYDTAEKAFRKAINTDPEYSLAYTYLGHTLYKKGQHGEASTQWTKATIADPHSEGAAIARRKLERVARKSAETNQWARDFVNRDES